MDSSSYFASCKTAALIDMVAGSICSKVTEICQQRKCPFKKNSFIKNCHLSNTFLNFLFPIRRANRGTQTIKQNPRKRSCRHCWISYQVTGTQLPGVNKTERIPFIASKERILFPIYAVAEPHIVLFLIDFCFHIHTLIFKYYRHLYFLTAGRRPLTLQELL